MLIVFGMVGFNFLALLGERRERDLDGGADRT
jgi:hypothetical protein